MSLTVKYGRETVSPGPGPRSWIPRRRPSVSVSQPEPASAGRPELDAEHALPEAERTIGVVRRKLDQRLRHPMLTGA